MDKNEGFKNWPEENYKTFSVKRRIRKFKTEKKNRKLVGSSAEIKYFFRFFLLLFKITRELVLKQKG
jgi:hypothetical protein